MIQINLLEEDGLSKSPVSLERPEPEEISEQETPEKQLEAPAEEEVDREPTEQAEEVQEAAAAPEETEEAEQDITRRPKIPGAGERKQEPTQKRRYEPKKSPFSRGPSIGVIIFLLVVVVGVTLYFLLRNPDQQMTPVPVTPPEETTTPEQPGETGVTPTEPAEEAPTPQPETTQESASPTEETSSYVPYAGIERNEQDIIAAIQHGRRKVESIHTILSATSGEGHINFLSISDDHLTLNARVYSAGMADRLHQAILGTSVIDTIALFYKDDISQNEGGSFNIDLFSDIRHPDMAANKNDLKIATLSQIYAKAKEWIGIPSIELLAWKPQKAGTIDGWARGPMYVQFAGTKVSIMRVLKTIQKAGYNVGISKIYIYNHADQPMVPGPYQVKLYLTLFGKAE